MRFDESELLDAAFIVGLYGLVAARIGHIAINWIDFGLNPIRWLNLIGEPGLWYPLGLIGASVGTYAQAKKRKWNVYRMADALVVGLTLGLSIMSFGSFLNGSGLGGATDSIFGLRFPGLYDKRLPVPLYETVLYALLFRMLWKLESTYRTIPWYRGNRSQANPGFITGLFLVFHGCIATSMILLKPPVKVYGIPIELIWSVLVIVAGTYMVTRQSAYSFFAMLKELLSYWTTSLKRRLPAKKDPASIQFFK